MKKKKSSATNWSDKSVWKNDLKAEWISTNVKQFIKSFLHTITVGFAVFRTLNVLLSIVYDFRQLFEEFHVHSLSV